MQRFLGLIHHEIRMALRRKGLWIAYGLLFLFHTVLLFSPPPLGEMVKGEVISKSQAWSVAGRFLVAVNVFFPVVAGILSADRMQRDVRLGLRELQESTLLSRPVYVLAKYLAALAACLFPLVLWVIAIPAVMVATGRATVEMLLTVPVAFLAITVPAFAFVVAFSIACPMVMPASVYQILFTGYWLWANFVPPKLFPTLNGTLLTPSGIFALQAFFGEPGRYTKTDAVLNLGVLGLCIAAALFLLERLLQRQAQV